MQIFLFFFFRYRIGLDSGVGILTLVVSALIILFRCLYRKPSIKKSRTGYICMYLVSINAGSSSLGGKTGRTLVAKLVGHWLETGRTMVANG